MRSSVRVIEPPSPIVVPGDIPGDHDANDAQVAAMIAAVTRTIDGPSGWLGRALGVQTLEMVLDNWPCRRVRLRYQPIVDIVSVSYFDLHGDPHTVADSDYRLAIDELLFGQGFQQPTIGCFPDAIRIRYRAGYNGTPVLDGGTGDVPAEVKVAITIMVTNMIALSKADGVLRSFEVQDAYTKQYSTPELVDQVRSRAVEMLLSSLRVWSI